MLERLIPNVNTIRVIEFLIIHEGEQNQQDLCQTLSIYPKAMRSIIKTLVKYDLIHISRRIAKSIFYKINSSNELITTVRRLIHQFNKIDLVNPNISLL